MKGKKWLTIITFFCSAAAIAAAFLIGKESSCIGYDIAMAVFGSALLGLIMSLTEYFVARRTAMEAFWDEARKALSKLRRYKYILIDAPSDLVQACFREEWSNEFVRLIDQADKQDAKKALISWLEENVPMYWRETDDIDAELDRIYAQKIQDYRDTYMQAIDSYIEVASIDLGFLGNAYGNLDFLFCNSIRNKAFNEIYNMIQKYRDLARTEVYHFNLLKEEKGNFPVCAKKALSICHEVFQETEQIEGGFKMKVVYQKAFDDIDQTLETFRCRIYRNVVPNYPARIPVVGNVQSLNFEEASE